MVVSRIVVTALSAILLACLAVRTVALAADQEEYSLNLSEARLNLFERNLVRALESNSPGLQASAAQVIRNLKRQRPTYKFSECVIPLMRIVKDESRETGVRIVAALALHELRTARGDFAISRKAAVSKDPRIKRLCTWLTYARMNKSGTAEDHQERSLVRASR